MIRYHARWICPVSSAPFSDGTVAVANGRIVYVGARSDAPREGNDVELGDVILMPGLVNAHCHLELTAMRGFLDGLGFREWIVRLTSARRAVLTQEMLLDAARLGVAEGLQHGITTFADTGDSGAGFDALLELGARGISYREVFGPDPSQCDEAIAGLAAKLDDMQQRSWFASESRHMRHIRCRTRSFARRRHSRANESCHSRCTSPKVRWRVRLWSAAKVSLPTA
jgi:5-methylthioadenosine/S-adenosylhomocysteine deaminase